MRNYELEIKGTKSEKRNPDTWTALCSTNCESTTLVTLRDIVIQVVKSTYTKIFTASILHIVGNSITCYFTWPVLINKSLQEATKQKPWVWILKWVNKLN